MFEGIGASRSIVVDSGSQEPEGSALNRILEYVRGNPGCHLRQMKVELDLAMAHQAIKRSWSHK